MRFTKGYWLTKENYTMSYATQWVRTARADQTLKVLAACKPIRSRGDILNSATLDVEFSAPMENVIRVKVVHFAGVQPKLPQFELREEAVQAVCAEEESKVSFRSGALEAVVHKLNGAWQVDFMADGRLLTQSGYHGMAHALDKTTGKSYLSDSLLLDVGECVYGLGERFGAYVKNGQTIDMWNADGGTA
ncbi:MAG: alpha-xylosidase, partial [Clostridia bacterium]